MTRIPDATNNWNNWATLPCFAASLPVHRFVVSYNGRYFHVLSPDKIKADLSTFVKSMWRRCGTSKCCIYTRVFLCRSQVGVIINAGKLWFTILNRWCRCSEHNTGVKGVFDLEGQSITAFCCVPTVLCSRCINWIVHQDLEVINVESSGLIKKARRQRMTPQPGHSWVKHLKDEAIG